MNTDTLLHTNKENVRKAVLEKLGKSDEDVQKDKQLIKNWFMYQQHLPQMHCENLLELFLIVNKFNLEKCKKKLDKYYTIRKEIPDLYIDKHPKREHMRNIANTVYVIPLPKITPSLSRITLIKLKDNDPEKFVTLNYYAHGFNIVEIRLKEDMALTDTILYDLEGIQLGHLFKLRYGYMKKSISVIEKVFSTRLEGIHFINLPNSMQVLINLVKTLFREKMRKRIHVHKNLESLCRHLPKELLPQDYGGDEVSLNELHGLWLEKLRENYEFFDYLETLAPKKNDSVPENKREHEENAYLESDFKQLSID